MGNSEFQMVKKSVFMDALTMCKNCYIGEGKYGCIKPEALSLVACKKQEYIDFNALKEEFTKACPDFNLVNLTTEKSFALRFAERVIYKFNRQCKAIKKSRKDASWAMRLPNNITIFVSSFYHSEPPKALSKIENNILLLTIEQASLLALVPLCEIVASSIEMGRPIITPLAGAIFSVNSIKDIAVEIFGHDENKIKQNMASILISINQSCIKGGHYLEKSEAHIALVACICSTINMENKRVRDQIILTTYQQYAESGKQFDEEKFWIYAKYVITIPDQFFTDLFNEFEKIQREKYNITKQPVVTAQKNSKEADSVNLESTNTTTHSNVTRKENSSAADSARSGSNVTSIQTDVTKEEDTDKSGNQTQSEKI